MIRPPRAVVLAGTATAFSLFGDQMLYAVLPTYFRELGLMPYQVGLVLSVNRWIRLFTNHLAERLTRRYNPTPLLAIALLVGAGVTALYATVTLFPVLISARLLWGLCWSFIRQVGLMTTVDSAATVNAGQAVGYYNGIARTGSIGGNLIGALGHDLIGFSPTLLIFSLISLVGVPVGVRSRHGLGRAIRTLRHPTQPRIWRHNRGLLLAGFVVGCVGPGLILSSLGLVLKETLGDSIQMGGLVIGVATLTGLLLAGRWLTDTLGAPMLGALTDRLGRGQSALLFFAMGALVLFVARAVSGMVPLILLVLLFFVCGTTLTVVTIAEAGRRGSQVLAALVTAADMGSALGPVLGWTSQQFLFSTDIIFAIGGGLYTLACLIVVKAF